MAKQYYNSKIWNNCIYVAKEYWLTFKAKKEREREREREEKKKEKKRREKRKERKKKSEELGALSLRDHLWVQEVAIEISV